MSSRLTRTETAVKKLQSKARKRDSSIKEMDAGLTTLNKEVSELRGKLMEKEEQINNLHMKHLYLESYSQRENLKFFGIEEKEKNAKEGSQAMTHGQSYASSWKQRLVFKIEDIVSRFSASTGLKNPSMENLGQF